MTSTIFDLTETVTQIIKAERAQLDHQIRVNKNRKSEMQALDKVRSDFRSLIASLDDLQFRSTFESKKAKVSDNTVVSASPGVGAAEIKFDVTVNSLAEAARVHSTAVLFSAVNADYKGTRTTLQSGNINSQEGQFINPNATLASGNINLDTGKTLTTGSFKINNATILVTASDTVNTILTKINNSSAEVTASFDEDNDQITLEHKNRGSTGTISLSDDSTGFFNAMRLNDGTETVTQGKHSDLLQKLNTTNLAVDTGYFTVNNHTFFVNAESDTLNSVILRVNNSSAGVSLFYDVESDKVTMTSKTEGQSINLKNDTSGFLGAIHVLDVVGDEDVSAGKSTYTGTNASVTVNGTAFTPEGNTLTLHGTRLTFLSVGDSTVNVAPDHDLFVGKVKDFIAAYNKSAGTVSSVLEEHPTLKMTFQRALLNMRNMLAGSISNPGTFSFLADVGITFSERSGAAGRLQLDEGKFRDRLESDGESVSQIFSFDSSNNGLRNDGGVTQTLENYVRSFTRGSFGVIDRRKDFLQSTMERVDNQILSRENYFERRQTTLTERLIRTQRVLRRLQEQFSRAQSITVDFDLITGRAFR